jgi:S-adenosylmethionine decarboxylase
VITFWSKVLIETFELNYLRKKLDALAPHEAYSPSALQNPQTKSVTGLHIVANFRVQHTSRLLDYSSFKSFIDLLIEEFKLSKLGEVYQNLDTGGFTGIVSLRESHLSIHTWPDQYQISFDVFLTNHFRDNQPTAHALYQSVKHFFNATASLEEFLQR